MTEHKDIITIDKKELEILDKENKNVEMLNHNIMIMRKKHLYMQLATASEQRIRLLKKIEKWITVIENRIFNEEEIDNLSIDKVIALFKYIANLQLKALVHTDKVENILGKYLTSDTLKLQKELKEGNIDVKEDIIEMKKDITKAIKTLIHKNIEDTEPVKEKKRKVNIDNIDIEDLEPINDDIEDF